MMKESDKSSITALVLLATFAAFFFYSDYRDERELLRREREEEMRMEEIRNGLAGLDLRAKAVSVYDATGDKKIYGKNDGTPLPIASLAKTMTVLVALREKSGGTVSTTSSAISQNGDYGLFAGEKWKTPDLARFTLIVSSNDGAYALSQGSEGFLEKMNEKAKKIGMKQAVFLSPTGLDTPDSQPSAFASAEDVNVMSIYAYRAHPEVFGTTVLRKITLSSESGYIHSFKNTNSNVDKIPNLLFSKTGYTELAGGNLAVIFKDRKMHEIAVTVLGSTQEGRFSDMEKIVDVLY